MNKAKILLVLAFIVVCAAGVVVGTAVDWHVRPVAPPPPPGGLFDRLHLSPEQQSELRQAWDPVGQTRKKMFQDHRQNDDQRWSAIEKLFTPEQKKQYDQIEATYHQKNKELEDQLSSAVAHATDSMKQILTPEQYQAWDQMRKEHGFGHEKHGPGSGPPGMGPRDQFHAPGMGPSGMGGPEMGLGLSHGHHHHLTTRPTTEPTTDPV